LLGADAALRKGRELWHWSKRCYFDIPVAALRRDVKELRVHYDGESDLDLARRVYAGLAWKSSVMGLVIGVPGHPAIALPLAFAEAAMGFRMQVIAACKVALIYDPDFFFPGETGAQALERLKPLFGGSVRAAPWAKLEDITGKKLALEIFQRVAGRSLQNAARKGLVNLVGSKAGQRVLRVVPIVGAVVGAAWNAIEACTRGERIIAHFEAGRATASQRARPVETSHPHVRSPHISGARGPIFEVAQPRYAQKQRARANRKRSRW
jgi:hypothetical protein